MTHKLLKSNLSPPSVSYDDTVGSFGRIVQAMCAEKKAHHDHHMIVHALVDTPLRCEPRPEDHEDADDPIAAWRDDHQSWCRERDERHMPYPSPVGPADVMASIKTVIDPVTGEINYEPDFEIINDDPTPEQVLAAKKNDLILAVHQAENEAIAKVQLPIGKQRAANLREGDIRSKHATMLNEAIKGAKDEADANAIKSRVEASFDQDEVAFLKDQERRNEAVLRIIRIAADATSKIEDLTSDNIGDFVMPKFEE